jgi:hypothetical protein
MVRGTVGKIPDTMLAAEADRLCNARRYERAEKGVMEKIPSLFQGTGFR